MDPIAHNLATVRGRIDQASRGAGRPNGSVRLLAVSKTFPAEAVRAAHAAGQHAFGENYVQEGLDKVAALADLRAQLEWHFIGPLQSNKTRPVAEHFDWVHSVDRQKIAQRLSDQRPAHLPPLNVCLQVNISGEASKSGVSANEVLPLARALLDLPRLVLRGLMAIPEPAADLARQREPHRRLRELFENIRGELHGQGHVRTAHPDGLRQIPQAPACTLSARFDTLSIGMSADLEAAVLEGATLVRIGTAIFGVRHDPASSPIPSTNQNFAPMKIAFIGAGNMAGALIGGLLRRGHAPHDLLAIDPNSDTRAQAARQGVRVAAPGEAQLTDIDLIVLAVKPQMLKDVAHALAPELRHQTVLSIAAGIRAADLARWLGGYTQVIRAMPNTPALIGMGVTGVAALPGIDAAARARAQQALEAVGQVVWCDAEEQLDAVTAISGSGPAYVFYFMEAMQSAASALGLSEAQGRTLALSTFAGAAQLALQSSEPPGALRERVTSKNGATAAALAVFDAARLSTLIVEGALAAHARSIKLGEQLGAADRARFV